MNDRIDILLAVFNGEQYLSQQLDSILTQTYYNWHLIIRDDCSTDNTRQILDYYVSINPDRITLIDNEGKNLGACLNFATLLQHITANYIMFCDQDDIWFPDKITMILEKMHKMENDVSQGTPLLVHTDLRVVDKNLKVLVPSLWHYQVSNPDKGRRLNRLLLQNIATGCTVMINKPLRDIALPVPREAMMHDWWLALVAAAFGQIGHICEPTMLYRQHEKNALGARQSDFGYLLWRFLDMCNVGRAISYHKITTNKIQKQAEVFLQRYQHHLNPKYREMIGIYSRLNEQNFIMKRYYIFKYGFYYTGLIRNIGKLLLG